MQTKPHWRDSDGDGDGGVGSRRRHGGHGQAARPNPSAVAVDKLSICQSINRLPALLSTTSYTCDRHGGWQSCVRAYLRSSASCL